LVARQGDPIPKSNSLFPTFANSDIKPISNLAGDVAFVYPVAHEYRVLAERNGQLRVVMSENEAIPGTEQWGGLWLNSFGFSGDTSANTLRFNAAGEVAFVGDLGGLGGTQKVLISEGIEGLHMVAYFPGSLPDIEQDIQLVRLQDWALNDQGQVAFEGFLTGMGVTADNDVGIWAEDRLGVLRRVVREGDLVEVAAGDFRTVGRAFIDGFNEFGIGLSLSFTDGSRGAFVSDVVAIPEPSGIALYVSLTLSVCLFLCGRMRLVQRSLSESCRRLSLC
jgi:hypothetical protein